MRDPKQLVSLSTAGFGTDSATVARSTVLPLWIWPSFALLDAYMCFVAFPSARFGHFVAYRILVQLAFFAVYRRASTLRAERLFFWQSVCIAAAALTIAVMALELGGLESPYMHGISVVALVWAALMPASWRRSLFTFVSIGLSFPAVMGVSAALAPAIHDQWLDTAALVVFASNYVFVLASAALGLLLSHLVWSAQQKARNLGSYQLEEVLGRGGMGEVWRARHQLLARSAAIKLIRPDVMGDSLEHQKTAVARFEREAQATASLRSPHTVELYDFGVSEKGTFFYVMELLDGFDSDALVGRFGPLSAERTAYILLQVCDSLGEAHENGLVHRDIKPSNLYVCHYGRSYDFVKVLDFGLVKPRQVSDQQLSADNSISGTPGFLAPEQILGEHAVDGRCDIYALGCVAYWLLTGDLVFDHDSALPMLAAHVSEVPVPPSQRTKSPIPKALDDLVLKCLMKDPGARPQSTDELATALASIEFPIPWNQERAARWWKDRPTTPSPDAEPAHSTERVRMFYRSTVRAEKAS